ncbi:4-hydroxythreonine-4-phosphate dehydrogenase PdxA [Kineococcus sp. SYSU DK005]|uniref:4-hydroxythreonine-4-phosphate dehydrogenase PdxA n=1 Tax=Kineococcus sp. SYSU DK005 TaxID=3383126 RepID=UPI003D7D967D
MTDVATDHTSSPAAAGAGARPRIAVTLGDPAGVGPELVAKLLALPGTSAAADVVLVSDTEEIASAGRDAGVDIRLSSEPGDGLPRLHPTRGVRPEGGFVRQRATAEGGRWSLDALSTALDLVRADEVDAVVFASLNKTSMHLAGMTENDELHWFESVLGADPAGDGFTCEINVLPGLMTSRVTSHVSVAEVDAGITPERVLGATRLLDRLLRERGVASPSLAVCALNPHAGEGGRFGRHEIEVISPAVQRLRAEGIDVQGPFPSDTIFLRARTDEFDGVVTMYHDQGQIAMKLLGFDRGVTVAGGLSVPICTPAHGTAFDIVGQGRAGIGAMQHAFEIAVSIASQRRAAATA